MKKKIRRLRKKLAKSEISLPSAENLKNFIFFIGFGRSGHSFIGQVINAHPDALIGNEGKIFDVLSDQLIFENILKYLSFHDKKFAARKYFKKNGQDFYFPGLAQGEVRVLKTLGNSKAGYAKRHFYEQPSLLKTYQSVLPAEMKFIFVVRDPRDIVGSVMKRTKIDFETAIEKHIKGCKQLEAVLGEIGNDFKILKLVYEDFVENLDGEIQRIFDFLGLDMPNGFVDAIRKKTYKSPDKSRKIFDQLPNTEERFQNIIHRHEFYDRYRE
jgi:hypothetical protein